MYADRLTKRTDEELIELKHKYADSLTFNELVALAGQKLAEKARMADSGMGNAIHEDQIDAGRDCSIARTHLEEALMRYNSACYRIAGTWQRVDPDQQGGYDAGGVRHV